MPRLGVIGNFVWDEIHGRDVRRAPVEEWGGITYALSALDAALPDEWHIVPLVKVGSDLWPRAREFLATLRHLAPDAAPIEVPYPNNRVRLEYTTDERRSEILSGGVPPWTWLGLRPLLRDLDALYVNLISGFELDLETLRLVRAHFHGPIYLDLHSLLLGIESDGTRTPRYLENAEAWCACGDLLQVNEAEMSMMAPDPMALAATALRAGVRALLVTFGRRGAVYFTVPGFERLSDLRRTAPTTPLAGAVRTALVPAVRAAVDPGDPTGCGDVFGATHFSRMLAGDNFADALHAALRAAARNVEYRGATSLASFLRGELLST
ncbi:MAG TPA: PfkB family carbohydrate kinase [Gemmatimonadaceae bacterium]|nr:PfkB family carbohydrate kinase [Gemmatimonadaceae bacterium]